MKHWAKKIDANQGQIVQCLHQMGCAVQTLDRVGCGCPDLLVSRDGVNYLFEVKTPKGKIRQIQKEWHDSWKGQVAVIHNIHEALLVMGIGKK